MIRIETFPKSFFDATPAESQELQQKLKDRKQYYITFLATPGAGKTTLFKKMVPMLQQKQNTALVLSDSNSFDESYKLSDLTNTILQIRLVNEQPGGLSGREINTEIDSDPNSRFLNAVDARAIFEMIPEQDDIVLVENNGSLDTPITNESGAHMEIIMVAVPEGQDLPKNYPSRFKKADVVLINKIDLASLYEFDLEQFTRSVQAINPNALVLAVSARDPETLIPLVEHIVENRKAFLAAD